MDKLIHCHPRGSVLGISKAFLGLSTSIYASIYWGFFQGGLSQAAVEFVGFLAIVPAAATLLASAFINVVGCGQ